MAATLSGGFAGETRCSGLDQMTLIERLPLLRPDVQVHYEGSIDKRGGNADWDWWLYQDANTREWVICEADGPGCLWNFVVHHAVAHSDPVYRFYIDGNNAPAFEIRHSEFGRKAPFVAPLADKFIPPVEGDARLKAIDFQIVRSFCPMPFRRSLRITSSVQLIGNHETGGGWGHAIWHSYPTAEGLRSFTGREDISTLLGIWRNLGEDPKPRGGVQLMPFKGTVPGRARRSLLDLSGQGSLSAIRLRMEPATPTTSGNLWLRITWDGEVRPAIECPVGAFFGNEFGKNHLQTLMQGVNKDGMMYNYWPMPFWQSARVELENRGDDPVSFEGAAEFKPSAVLDYPRKDTGHFRASAYQPMTSKPHSRDSLIAEIAGNGHVVAGLITAEKSFCEGDLRVHIDGRGTPAVESDGSESWACYGWGFEFPPQSNPASSYDGVGNPVWSMLRLLMGDCCPFRTGFRMTVEGGSGTRDNGDDRRSGLVFWYGEPEPAMVLTDFLNVGDPESESRHGYSAPASVAWALTSAFEGEFDNVPIADSGRTLNGPSQFTAQIGAGNQGVLLRRRSDQMKRGQRARVSVDGQPVLERIWIAPDGNPHFRWLEDEFLIPPAYTRGKRKIVVRIEPEPVDEEQTLNWNESSYSVFSLGVTKEKP